MWEDQYHRILRHRNKAFDDKPLIKSYAVKYTVPDVKYLDDTFTCILHIHHLKDWLISCGHLTNEEANSFIEQNQELKICQSICNGGKHLTTEFRERKIDIIPELISKDHKEKGSSEDKIYTQVVIISGNMYYADELISQAITIWEDRLRFMKLIE